MAFQAVSWLSGALGVDITGRDRKAQNAQQGGQQGGQNGDGGDVFSSIGDTVFGTSSGPKRRYAADGTEIDDQGLPVGRDWYYYDKDLGRMNVREDAPQAIKDEHAAAVAQMEAEKSGKTAVVAPPPPPPPPMQAGAPGSPAQGSPGALPPPPPTGGMAARVPSSPQYADGGYFS